MSDVRQEREAAARGLLLADCRVRGRDGIAIISARGIALRSPNIEKQALASRIIATVPGEIESGKGRPIRAAACYQDRFKHLDREVTEWTRRHGARVRALARIPLIRSRSSDEPQRRPADRRCSTHPTSDS
jgi:hypothetical protein